MKDRIIDYFFKTHSGYQIPLLRVLFITVTVKETYAVLHRIIYFSQFNAFYKHSFLSDSITIPLLEYGTMLKAIFVLLGALSILGVFTRYSLFLYGILYFLMHHMDVSYGIFNHEASLSSLVIFLLSFSPGIKNFSVDKLLKERRSIKSVKDLFTPHSSWSYKTIILFLAIGYFSAGYSKIKYGGFNWLDGETLGFYLEGHTSIQNKIKQEFTIFSKHHVDIPWKDGLGLTAYTYAVYPRSKLGASLAHWLAGNELMIALLSWITVLFEVSAIYILFDSRFRNFFLISAVIFHTCIGLLMGLSFKDYQVVNLCLLDWSTGINWIKRKFNFG